jgi:4-aminobutyrate aminotransferase
VAEETTIAMSISPDELRKRHRAALPEWLALYYERPIELVRGEGIKIWDSEGNEYLDFFGGIVTTISGHAIPEIFDAIKSQAEKLTHSSTLYLIENQVKLAEKLIELAPMSGDKKVFFAGSGTEANEAALLFATTYRKSSEVVALRGSYHGRSFATMGVTGQSIWRSTSSSALDVAYLRNPYRLRCPFCKNEPGCNLLCADDLRELIETETTGHVAAFIAEPIQGVGGFIEAPPGYFERIKEILDETDILLISDEVQTAFGRTGSHFWGIETFDVEPDLVTMAKGLGNGLAIGAVMGRAEVIDSISPNLHISTFGGNHLATAGALANLDYLLENDLQRNAYEVGGYLKSRLLKMADESEIVGEVRGRGLMLGIELVRPEGEPDPVAAVRFLEACRERGVLVGKGGFKANVIRISPPLTATRKAAEEVADVFEETLAEIGTKERV